MHALPTIPSILWDLIHGRAVTDAGMRFALEPLLEGAAFDEAATAAFLVGLRVKGETSSEIAAAARMLRERMISFDPGVADFIDTCGTGGDAAGTFNVSTATALVLAGCGIPVVKHGNRSVSSRSGSSDVLSALGIRIEGDADFVRRCVAETNMGFCFAPLFHPAMKNAAPLRKKLGVPTIFNLLGPLVNPARPPFQVLGVGSPKFAGEIATALAELGTRRALVVRGDDGLDEVSLSSDTIYYSVEGSVITDGRWSPTDFGLPCVDVRDLRVEDPQQSADLIRRVLDGAEDAPSWVVYANAAAALWLLGKVADVREGVNLARQTVIEGRAKKVLEGLQRLSSQPGLT